MKNLKVFFIAMIYAETSETATERYGRKLIQHFQISDLLQAIKESDKIN